MALGVFLWARLLRASPSKALLPSCAANLLSLLPTHCHSLSVSLFVEQTANIGSYVMLAGLAVRQVRQARRLVVEVTEDAQGDGDEDDGHFVFTAENPDAMAGTAQPSEERVAAHTASDAASCSPHAKTKPSQVMPLDCETPPVSQIRDGDDGQLEMASSWTEACSVGALCAARHSLLRAAVRGLACGGQGSRCQGRPIARAGQGDFVRGAARDAGRRAAAATYRDPK